MLNLMEFFFYCCGYVFFIIVLEKVFFDGDGDGDDVLFCLKKVKNFLVEDSNLESILLLC